MNTGLLVCPPGFADCNGDRSDGCEVNLSASPDHCGTCEKACGSAGTTARACVQGVCKATCDTKHADCDNTGDNGCEVDATSTATSCGACGRACSTTNATAEACVAGACKPTCKPNFGDCSTPASTAADNACETNLLTDNANCGGCGRSCQGGACQAGVCQPVLLAKGLVGPQFVAADAGFVYYGDRADSDSALRLSRIPANGGATTVIASTLTSTGLVSDGTYTYWTVRNSASSDAAPNGQIMRLQSGQTTPISIQTALDPMYLGVDGKNVYWSDSTKKEVLQASRDPNAGVTHLFSDPSPNALTSDGTTLYAASLSERTMFAVPVGGGSLTQLTYLNGADYTSGSAYLANDATHVYSFFEGKDGSVHLEQLSKPSLTGARELATGTAYSPYAPILYAANYVYFVEEGGVHRVPTTTPVPVVTPVVAPEASNYIQYLAIAGGALYWTEFAQSDSTGSIRKLAIF